MGFEGDCFNGGEQALQIIGFVNGHQAGADGVLGGVEGNGNVDRGEIPKPFNLRDQAGGGEGDLSLGEAVPLVFHKNLGGLFDLLKVV